ncbi:hypothetical protein [Pseudomonas mosselii]|uniref:DUF4760 domain-containing protein n=1 Tax=Pseudomonas mosselii TaxID=78327 RepID=A0ABX9AXF5_9PSED|nr:hypothetical protein [Pseudomonas mosselii]QZP24530.1 hypothetical protein K5H97_16985 [Pseudomonas mosselii]
MMFFIIGLVGLQIFTSGLALYLFKSRNTNGSEIRPYDQFYIGLGALAFGLAMLYLFFVFVSPDFEVSQNLGQVGDFVGGLTNPALSFIALIVLLRTTLIQTDEARKTSSIMLEQQEMMREERFESTFYTLLGRYEEAADRHLRSKEKKERLTVGLRMVQRLLARREEFDSMPLKQSLPMVKEFVDPEFRIDTVIKTIARAWKVIDFIDGSSIPSAKKGYYFAILSDAMEPCEMVIVMTHAFDMRNRRRLLRKYHAGKFIKLGFYPCAAIGRYFGARLKE